MSETLVVTIVGLLMNISYANLEILLPRRFNNTLSVVLPALFVSVFYTAMLSSRTVQFYFGGARGLIHLPMIFLLTRGKFFNRLFCILMHLVIIGVLSASTRVIGVLCAPYRSFEYYVIVIILTVVFYTVYGFLTWKYGKWFIAKLFLNEYAPRAWALYSLCASFFFCRFRHNV
jgi:hypothetical protein